ncbi:MAG: rhodanese-like domain-containing protein [Anaerolineae bacterium]|nr:rhodanese-like domain-containing protein [Anaerolineae bacterium]
MTIRYKTQVSGIPAAESADANAFFRRKLGYETDCADVYHDLKHGIAEFVLLDVRSADLYRRSHVPGAINLPHAQITSTRMSEYAPATLFVVYCAGSGCNGATRAAIRLSELGYPVKEMIGGMEFWEHSERYPTVRDSDEIGQLAAG